MAKEQDSTNPEDFTSEISSELEQLRALSELLEGTSAPNGYRESFFFGLSALIAGVVNRIESMLDPTYDYLSQRSTEVVFNKIRGLREGHVLLLVPKRWMQRGKHEWELLAEKVKELLARKTISAQDRRMFSMGIESFGALLWDYLEKHEATFDNLNLIAADVPTAPWA